jgi:PBSX family phage terminase large subunit
MSAVQIELPPKLVPVFSKPRGKLRYRGSFGGRGSGKSFTFAKMAAIWGYAEKLRILCTRELQVSIKESFHAEVKNAIASEPWLTAAYDVGVDYIRGKNGTEFLFRGLRHNMSGIKSMAQIDLCIVEEAEDVPEDSWRDLLPTIRAPGSELWIIWNPKTYNSPVDMRFRQNTPPRSHFVEMNYTDNPWFPKELDDERLNDKAILSQSVYDHIWEGAYLTEAEDRIYHFFQRHTHDSKRAAQPGERLHIGLDFNIGGCCATVWVIDGLKTTAVDEFVSYDTQDFINNLSRFNGHQLTIYPDASGGASKTNASMSDIALIRQAGFAVDVPHRNPAVRDRINAVNTMLAQGNLFVNTERCPELTNALEMHTYNDRGDPTKYTTHPAIDDWSDCSGYFIHRKFPVRKPVTDIKVTFAV